MRGRPRGDEPEDSAFDLRARAELSLAFEPSDAPARLYRRPPPLLSRRAVRATVLGLLLAGSGTGGVLAMRPPALVRDAIEHEQRERLLRGRFMPVQQLLAQLGLDAGRPLPGLPQLMRPCDIDGRLAYHLVTFFEKGGMVTVFAFAGPVAMREGGGWWNDVHWQVVTSRDGRPLVLVSPQKKALALARASLAADTADAVPAGRAAAG